MERVLEYEKYRNLGLKTKERLVLNKSLEKGKMGNLVIVVGANNSGKSNVLDGLLAFGEKKFTQKDITTLSYDSADRNPALALTTKDGDDIYSYKFTASGSRVEISYPCDKYNIAQVKKEWFDACVVIQGILVKNRVNLETYHIEDIMRKIQSIKTFENAYEVEQEIIQTLNTLQKNYDGIYSSSTIWRTIKSELENVDIFQKSLNSKMTDEQILKSKFLAKYNIEFMPKIYKYSEVMLSNSDLKTTYQSFTSNVFFKSLFNSISFSAEEIKNAYADFNKIGDKGILTSLERKLNKKLKQVSKKFNQLYVLEDDTYSFAISLESTNIYFVMTRNEQNITLDYQSTGFRWFFNLYFNLLSANKLNPGDIVIMDEPATNLHVKGQQELRVFLKEFAMKNDITIVLATHSPFLIDMDYLDELRVVTMDNNISSINNDFSTIDLDDPDSLKPIKEALTVNNHVLFDPDNKVVFVEGITDYNYMVAFKRKFDIRDIVFLPIKGVGKYGTADFKARQKEISKRLIKIKKHMPILMVDGDGAGNSMKNTNKDSELSVFSLSDISPKFKEIEDLFSQEDKSKFNLEKHSSTSAQFKTFEIESLTLSKETLDNFKQVFDYIDKM